MRKALNLCVDYLVHLLGVGGPPAPLMFICQWLKAQHTTAYSPGSSITSQPTNFFTARLLWANKRPRVILLLLPKEARKTMMHRSSRWLSAVSERLLRRSELKLGQGQTDQLGRNKIKTFKNKLKKGGLVCLPASLLEESKLQSSSLQHSEGCDGDRAARLAGEAALQPHLLPVRVDLADVHGIKVPVGKDGRQNRAYFEKRAPSLHVSRCAEPSVLLKH